MDAAMSDAQPLNITSLTNYLHHHRPDVLACLQADYPAAAAEFSPGKRLGSNDIQGEAISTEALERLARESIALLKENGKVVASSLEEKLKKAQRLRMTGNLLGGGAAAGVIGAVAIGQQMVTLASSVVVVISSALALMAEYSEGISGGKENRHVLRHKLGGLLVDASELEGEIKLLKFNPSPREACLGIVRSCNVIAAGLRRIEFELGRA